MSNKLPPNENQKIAAIILVTPIAILLIGLNILHAWSNPSRIADWVKVEVGVLILAISLIYFGFSRTHPANDMFGIANVEAKVRNPLFPNIYILARIILVFLIAFSVITPLAAYQKTDWTITKIQARIEIRSYSNAIINDPGNFYYYLARGKQYEILDDYQKAIIDYSAAIKLNSNFSTSYLMRGYAYTILEKYDDAKRDFDRAKEIDPNDEELYIYLGIFYASQNRFKDSIAQYDKSIEINSLNPMAYLYRGYSYERSRKISLALDDYNQALQQCGQNKSICDQAQEAIDFVRGNYHVQ